MFIYRGNAMKSTHAPSAKCWPLINQSLAARPDQKFHILGRQWLPAGTSCTNPWEWFAKNALFAKKYFPKNPRARAAICLSSLWFPLLSRLSTLDTHPPPSATAAAICYTYMIGHI